MSVISPAKTLTVKCPVCCAESSTSLFKFGTSLFPINVSICDECGFVFQNPRVSEEDWNHYYERGIYDLFHRPRPTKDKKCVNDTGLITYKRVYHFFNNAIDTKHDLTFQESRHKRRICEIGAGHGDIITSFKEWGDLFAIEPSENCRQVLSKKGVTVIGRFVTSINKNMTFNIVLMRHVLEHIYYPKNILKAIISLLPNNGILYIAVPNIFVPNFVNMFTYPHISYFSIYSLTYLCQLVGFEVLEIREDNDEIWCILSKDKYVENPKNIINNENEILIKNISETRNIIQKNKFSMRLIERVIKRYISNIMPCKLLIHLYERRNKTTIPAADQSDG